MEFLNPFYVDYSSSNKSYSTSDFRNLLAILYVVAIIYSKIIVKSRRNIRATDLSMDTGSSLPLKPPWLREIIMYLLRILSMFCRYYVRRNISKKKEIK